MLADIFAQYCAHRLAKYFDGPYQTAVAEEWCERYGLPGAKPMRILDLGGGLGWFARRAADYGHFCTVLDLQEDLIQKAADALSIPYIPHTIRDDTPLPVSGRYHLVTMHRVNVIQDNERWGVANYRRFTSQLLSRLRPGARWIIDPNTEAAAAVLDVPAWTAWLAGRGTAAFGEWPSVHPASVGGPAQVLIITKGA